MYEHWLSRKSEYLVKMENLVALVKVTLVVVEEVADVI